MAEAASIIGLSRKWKMTCFNTAHLVERLGLFTVVIMAKGILSVSRTTYRLFETVKWPLADNLGELACSIMQTVSKSVLVTASQKLLAEICSTLFSSYTSTTPKMTDSPGPANHSGPFCIIHYMLPSC